MLRLAVPVVLGELGWMAMGVADTIMVGRVSPQAIGAVGVGNILFHSVGIFGMGLLLGLDTLVPRAFGRGDLDDCDHSLLQAVYLSLVLGPVLMLGLGLFATSLGVLGLHPAVLELAVPYIRAVLWSTIPLLLFAAFRLYLQGMSVVHPVMVVLVTANLVNVFANWVLIFGHLGFPALGAEGAGWASCVSRVYMCLALLGAVLWQQRGRRSGQAQVAKPLGSEPGAGAAAGPYGAAPGLGQRWRLDVPRIRRLVRLGLPAATQRLLEIGVFAAATVLIGRLSPVALATHQIALHAISVTFMVPLGISTAGAVRVGQALGAGKPGRASWAGWTALLLGGGFMLAAGLVFLLAPRLILRIFTTDSVVISSGVSLLFVAAFFQLFDGLQVVATGTLRGAGDTRTAMIWNLVGHWLVGLPVGYWLCFGWGWGAQGLWVGLSVGLIAVALVVVYVWMRRTESWSAEPSGRRLKLGAGLERL